MSTATSTTTKTSHSSHSTAPTVRFRQKSHRRSSSAKETLSPLQICGGLPSHADSLDLSSVSPTQTLISLRLLVLSYLADVERQLSEIESPDFESWITKGEIKIEEARQWARTALDMLQGIRTDVCSHLPDIHLADLPSVENFLKTHIPELPNVTTLIANHSPLSELPRFPDMADVRSHLPQLPDMEDVRSHFPDFSDVLDDVRTCFQEIDFISPFGYVPTLSTRLQGLHAHLQSTEVEFTKMLGVTSLAPSSVLHELLEALLSSEWVAEIKNISPNSDDFGTEDMIERTASEVARAIKRSLEGMRLITYHDLPHHWKNNPFVIQGYRFIPLEQWPLLIKSIFKFHNEFLNIHTHLIPFILYLINIFSIVRNPTQFDPVEVLFMSFACVCLLASAIWHVMSGCAHRHSMELCARIDYVGIGWLISASVATVVHYGYQCYPRIGHMFMALCFALGLMGNVFPFMDWFNRSEYRFHRMGFFLSLAFSGIAPLIGMSYLHSSKEMSQFIAPIVPSFVSYLVGLAFYAYHWPERHLPENIRRYLDCIGGGSHAIWHLFIVLAVSQHKQGIQTMKGGLQCLAEYTLRSSG